MGPLYLERIGPPWRWARASRCLQNSTTGAAVAAGQTVSVKVNGLSGRPDDLNPASPGTVAGAQTATDVTITSK
jgi:hypothetical protein